MLRVLLSLDLYTHFSRASNMSRLQIGPHSPPHTAADLIISSFLETEATRSRDFSRLGNSMWTPGLHYKAAEGV